MKMNLRNSLIILGIMVLLLVVPSIVNATVSYTREIPSNDGSITLNLKGLTLDENTAYSYALTTKGAKPETWHTVTDFTNNTAKINLSASTKDIVNVLKVTDKGSLYIKNNSDDSYVVNALEVNLKLPYLQAGPYNKTNHDYNFASAYLYGSIGNNYIYTGANHTYTYVQKITDSTFIQKFLDVKNNNKNITSLESSLPAVPSNGYSTERVIEYKNENNDGLYIIWVKRSGDNCKDVYSAVIHDGLPEATTVSEYIKDANAPKVKEIKVISPNSGTYKTSQTVKIRVYFTEKITGTTVPTLKIKFGESAERDVTNGTIKDNYIEYSYNIQAGDNGQLTTVSLTGGTIKNATGIDAELSCPLISGNTIKANTEGITNNNTDNQDKNNDNTDKDDNKQDNNTDNKTDNKQDNTDNKDNSSSNNNQNSNNNANNSGKDDTVAGGKIPQTGATITLGALIVSILGIGIVAFKKYSNLRDI
ncbi:MAG: hypothetical protein HFJ58_04340 [Clostridia bacterium]|nr:hypothetical protein [Clostridia bacterium]